MPRGGRQNKLYRRKTHLARKKGGKLPPGGARKLPGQTKKKKPRGNEESNQHRSQGENVFERKGRGSRGVWVPRKTEKGGQGVTAKEGWENLGLSGVNEGEKERGDFPQAP